jgi:predicted HicB family RNase H-like nuclease
MAKRTPPKVTTDAPIGHDVDLDLAEVRLKDGTRLTEKVAAEIVEQVRRGTGRPSLSGQAAPSPQIAFRVPQSLRDRAAEIAEREGKTISQLAREALEERVRAS